MEKLIVLDTNCLLQALGAKSKYRKVWSDFLKGRYTLCVSNEIMHEYEEILKQRSSPRASTMFMMVVNYSRNVITKDPYFSNGKIITSYVFYIFKAAFIYLVGYFCVVPQSLCSHSSFITTQKYLNNLK